MKTDLTDITLVIDRSGSMEESWRFTFLGAAQDAFGEAGGSGIAAAGTANFAKDKARAAFAGTTRKVARPRTQRRTGQAASNDFTEEEREDMQ